MYFRLFILFITLFNSVLAFAYEGVGFKVLSETITSSPGVRGGFTSASPTSKTSSLFAQALSSVRDVQGRAMQTVYLRADHSASIGNHTSLPQTYTYFYELNCDGQYYRKTDKILVQPGGYAINNHNSFMFTSKFGPGAWKINAISQVTGESQSMYTSSATLKITL